MEVRVGKLGCGCRLIEIAVGNYGCGCEWIEFTEKEITMLRSGKIIELPKNTGQHKQFIRLKKTKHL